LDEESAKPPEMEALIESRIAVYTERAAAELPLFGAG
jgi:hypothetical protein